MIFLTLTSHPQGSPLLIRPDYIAAVGGFTYDEDKHIGSILHCREGVWHNEFRVFETVQEVRDQISAVEAMLIGHQY